MTAPQQPRTPTTDQWARRFHEEYERLAPSFGYETRKASAVPWERVPEQNRQLMEAVAATVIGEARTDLLAQIEKAVPRVDHTHPLDSLCLLHSCPRAVHDAVLNAIRAIRAAAPVEPTPRKCPAKWLGAPGCVCVQDDLHEYPVEPT